MCSWWSCADWCNARHCCLCWACKVACLCPFEGERGVGQHGAAGLSALALLLLPLLLHLGLVLPLQLLVVLLPALFSKLSTSWAPQSPSPTPQLRLAAAAAAAAAAALSAAAAAAAAALSAPAAAGEAAACPCQQAGHHPSQGAVQNLGVAEPHQQTAQGAQ